MKVNDINDNLFGDITKGYYRFYYRKQQFFPPRISSHTQLFEVFHILAPLHDTPFIACLIFGMQALWTGLKGGMPTDVTISVLPSGDIIEDSTGRLPASGRAFRRPISTAGYPVATPPLAGRF